MRVAGGILRAEFKRQVPQFEYERSSCGVVARTGWLREVTEGLSFLDCGKSPYLLGKCQGVGLCHYSFTVKLKCHVFFCSTCIRNVKYTWTIVPLHLFNFGMLRTQRFTENSPKGTQSPLKREKKRFTSYRQLGKKKKTPTSDQDRISPFNINTISSRKVTRRKLNNNLGIKSWSNTKFSELTL